MGVIEGLERNDRTLEGKKVGQALLLHVPFRSLTETPIIFIPLRPGFSSPFFFGTKRRLTFSYFLHPFEKS